MATPAVLKATLVVIFLWLPLCAQVADKKGEATHDFSKEGAVIEQWRTNVVFQSDGTSSREFRARVKIQSDAGVREFGVLRLPYQALVERVEIHDVKVTSPSGTVVATPLDSIQDVTSEIYRDAPLYSDLREKHIAVKGLEPGDTLEYTVRWQLEKPFAKGQFWFGYPFVKTAVVLNEQLEISVPLEREVRLKSQTVQPATREEAGRRIYTWKRSNVESQSAEKQKELLAYDAFRGLLPPPDVLISSFRTWEEVGRWYEGLQQEQIQPSAEVKAKAEELTKGLPDDDAKLRAIYSYVSLRYRYVAISFGIGRYQPHSAAEILGNQYGDCKDKHTLLAALLGAIGIRAYPALINSRMTVDADVPSPGQFDHVISVVAKGSAFSWMDTTPEITPIGDLVYPLRGKPALVIMPDRISFQNTPSDPPFANNDKYTITAKLDVDGTLEAHQEWKQIGDSELYFRYAFRQVPESQWKDLLQRNSYAAQLGGTIGNVRASQPENTEEPFAVAYDYTLKDFSGGDKHRFVLPIPLRLPTVKDEDLTRTTPLWLDFAGESQYEIRIELPKGWSAFTPASLDLKERFAEFHGSSEVHDGVLITKRRLLIKTSYITPDQLTSYKAFQKALSDHYNTYTFLRPSSDLGAASSAAAALQGPGRGIALLRQHVADLPDSSNSEALQAELAARKSLQMKDFASAIAVLKQAVSLDPHFSRAWILLGWTYNANADKSSAVEAFQKGVEADPKQVVPYKVLAFSYMALGRRDDAISTWQKLQSIAPGDGDIVLNLGGLYIAQKRYTDAAPLYQSAAKANPSDALAQMRLGMVLLRSHSTDQGMEAMHLALEIDSGAEMLNDVAYEMAEADTNLPDALVYSLRSVKDVEERSQKVDFAKIRKEDLQIPLSIGAYWDTLGWIYFKMGDLVRAENYLNSAWQLAQGGVMADHLGQVYEKEKKLPAALHMYSLALGASPGLEDIPARIRNLAQVQLPENRMSAGEELSRMRSFKIPTLTKEAVSADFDVLIVASGKIQEVGFLHGAELLRNAGDSVKKARIEEPFPPNSTAHLIRRGILSCSSYTGCSFVFYPPSVAASAN